jgi:hypothetical protein
MEIDKDKLLDELLRAFDEYAKMEAELLAHKVAFLLFTALGKFPELNQLLETARKNPTPNLALRHEEIRVAIRHVLDQGELDQALMKLLKNWKPEGPAS